MDWSDERYVRLYTRDTVTWKLWPWEARALFPLLQRKVDRAGILDLGGAGARGVAAIVDLPLAVVEPGLDGLTASNTVELSDSCLVIPNFIEAQEAITSGAQRMRDMRESRRAKARRTRGPNGTAPRGIGDNISVTQRHDLKRYVTDSDAACRSVTGGDSYPDRTVPNRTEPSDAGASDARARAIPVLPYALPEPATSTPAASASRLWDLQEQLVTGLHGGEARQPVPGELNGAIALLEAGWTEEQISIGLRAIAARGATEKREAGWLNRKLNWKAEVLRMGLARATGTPSSAGAPGAASAADDLLPSVVEAWTEVLREIRKKGSMRAPEFSQPLIMECVREIGWSKICNSTFIAGEQKLFERLYSERRPKRLAAMATEANAK